MAKIFLFKWQKHIKLLKLKLNFKCIEPSMDAYKFYFNAKSISNIFELNS